MARYGIFRCLFLQLPSVIMLLILCSDIAFSISFKTKNDSILQKI